MRTLRPDLKRIPGHGPVSTPADLDRAITMLRETLALVRQARRAGKSLEAVKKAGVPEKYRSWGEGFITTDAWLTTLYTELDPRKPKAR